MAAQKKGQVKVEERIQEPAPTLPQFYTGIFTIAHSAQDFRLVCFAGYTSADSGPGSGLNVQLKASHEIVMSPVTAKELMLALQANIERYENTFSEIKVPKKNK